MTSAPQVFRNGAWDPDRPGALNAYVSAVLSKDVYVKHTVDPRNGRAVRRNFTVFSTLFCRSMRHLGAEDCEPVAGYESLVWAVVRAGPSVLLVFRGSNTPQNWIADVASLRTINVGDFGGGAVGANVAAGFYKVFAANRRQIVDRVRAAMTRANEAAAAAATTTASAYREGGGGGNGAQGAGLASAGELGQEGGGGGGGGGSGGRGRLWVSGHSLGGAVALMTASYLQVREGLTATGVYTFGCPRVGDSSWAAAYDLHDVTLRLENTGDIVPTLPFGLTWRHVGAATIIQHCARGDGDGEGVAGTRGDGGGIDGGGGGSEVEAVRALAGLRTALRVLAKDRSSGSGGGLNGSGEGGSDGSGNEGDSVSLLAREGDDDGTEGSGEAGGDEIAHGEGGDEESLPQPMPSGTVVVTADGRDRRVSFPFPELFGDHWIQSYVRVMWSCLPDDNQELVPGPEDVYDPPDF